MSSSQPTSGELPDPVPVPRSDLGRLFLLGFVALVLALALIRYLAGSVFAPACLPELVLVAALLGAGAGCLFHHHVPGRLSSSVFAASSLGMLLLVVLVRYCAPAFPGSGSAEAELSSAGTGGLVFFAALFLSIAFTFYGVAQRAAKLFGGFAALTACSVTVGGALAGTLAFMLLGWLDAPPWIWFLLLIPPFVLVIGRDPRLPRLAAPVVLLCVCGLSLDQDLLLMRDPAAEGQLAVHWSPYGKVEHLWDPDDATHQVLVNGVASQEMLPSRRLARSCHWAVHSARSAAGRPPYARVLVLGAGVGNDVAAALANRAKHVDAVEIDPALVDVSRRHHPLHPYRNPKVTLAIDDPRAFLRRSSRRYDLVVIAPTRRVADVGPLFQLRRGEMEQLPSGIRSTRATDIDIFVCGQHSVVDKYRQEGTRIIYRRAGLAGLLVSKTTTGATVGSAAASQATGPGEHAGARPVRALVVSACAGGLLLLALGLRRRRQRRPPGEGGGTLSILAFVSIGVALGVLQSQGLDRQGGSWTGAFLVFLGILAAALVAIRLAGVVKTIPLWLISCLALGSGLVAASGLQLTLVSSDSPAWRVLVALLSYCPVVFGYLLFGAAVRGARGPARLAGASLLGAAVGGLLGCSFPGIGHGAGAIIVAAGYAAAFVLLTVARRRADPARAPLTGRAEQQAAWTDIRPRRLAMMLFLGLVAVYHLNGDLLPTGDAIPAGYLASSLFKEGDLSITPREAPFMFRGRRTSKAKDGAPISVYQERYYLVPTRHRDVFVSTFGPGPTIAALPVFALLRLACGDLTGHPAVMWYGAKSAAALFVAGSAVFVFLAALLFVRTRQALLIAAAYGLGTCVWSISSQALWQHGPNAFFLAMGSYFLLRHRERARFAVLSGVAFGCAVWCRPSSAVMVGVVALFLVIANRRTLVRFVAGGLPLALALLYYNMHYFGSMFRTGQAVRGPSVALAKTGVADAWQTPLWKGFLGLMVSPSRGLLVFSPFMAFALWGAVRVWRRGDKMFGLQVLSLGVASLLLMQFKWFDWWGGHAYGYRPIVDVMPILVLFLVAVVDEIDSRPVLRGVFGALLVWAIVVQVIGAFAYNERDWNMQRTEVRPMARSDSATLSYGVPYVTRAANVDLAAFRHRLWSVRDSLILHYMRFFGDARRRKKARVAARLALTIMPVLQAACSPPLAQAGVEGVIDVGTDQAHEFLRSGWDTVDEKLDARTARWVLGGTARVQVSLAPLLGDRRLTFTARPAKSQRPQRVVVNVNDAFVGQITMAPTWRTYRLLVPRAVLRPGVNHIDFKHDWCVRPVTFDPTSRDLRQLAAAYDRITLTALERSLPEAFEAKLGTTEERERLALCGGVDEQEEAGARTFVRSPGPALTFTLPLAPKSNRSGRYLFVVDARADGVGDTSSALRVALNGKTVGKVVMDRFWGNRSLVVAADVLRDGINTIKLTPASLDQPDTLLSRVWLRPLHRGAGR